MYIDTSSIAAFSMINRQKLHKIAINKFLIIQMDNQQQYSTFLVYLWIVMYDMHFMRGFIA